jgi:bromodomain and WD repeat domain-containing protein 1/3
LEGGWNPNGMNFAVSTSYGSFSMYGYGFRDVYAQTPVEQFYATDSEHPIINNDG